MLKSQENAEKDLETVYGGNWLRAVDICSGTVTYNDFKNLYFMLLILAKYNQNCGGYKIISVRQEEDDKQYGDVVVFVRPWQKEDAKEAISVNFEWTKQEENVLESLKMNIAEEDEDEEEEEEEEEEDNWLNLPGHVCKIQLIHS